MSLHEVPVETAIATLSRACAENEPISFFCGAGISVEAPALAPDWLLLRQGLVSSLFDEALAGRLLPAAVARRARRSWDTLEADTQIKVKPEVVLHFFQTTLKERLQPAYQVLAGGRPNPNHETLARLVVSGARVALATTNFDTYIEDAIGPLGGRARVHAAASATEGIAPFAEFKPGRSNAPSEIPLLKPHGTLTHPETIRATLRAVGKPAGDELRSALERLIADRHVVVIGYSGNDFDLFPVLQNLVPKARSVWWLCRSRARLNPDLVALPENGGLVVNDAGVFFRGLATARGWEVPPPIKKARRQHAEQVRAHEPPSLRPK